MTKTDKTFQKLVLFFRNFQKIRFCTIRPFRKSHIFIIFTTVFVQNDYFYLWKNTKNYFRRPFPSRKQVKKMTFFGLSKTPKSVKTSSKTLKNLIFRRFWHFLCHSKTKFPKIDFLFLTFFCQKTTHSDSTPEMTFLGGFRPKTSTFWPHLRGSDKTYCHSEPSKTDHGHPKTTQNPLLVQICVPF